MFDLIDRNLLLGETTVGVYMHDVVRDYAEHVAGEEAMRRQNCELVRLLLAATPPGGWRGDSSQMSAFVQESMLHHMRRALRPEIDPSSAAIAFGWLEDIARRTTCLVTDFCGIQAAEAVGYDVIMAKAEGTAEPWAKAQLYCAALATERARSFMHSGCVWSESEIASHPFRRYIATMQQAPNPTQRQRTQEVCAAHFVVGGGMCL